MGILSRLLGLALVVGAVWAAWWIYGQIPSYIRMIPQRVADVPVRGLVNDYRLLLEILAVFLGLSILDWLWRNTVGRLTS